MASAVLSSVLTTASRFALLQVDSGSGSDSEPGKGKGRSNGKSQTLGNKATSNEKKREKRRKKKEQQQSEANEVAMRFCVPGLRVHDRGSHARSVSWGWELMTEVAMWFCVPGLRAHDRGSHVVLCPGAESACITSTVQALCLSQDTASWWTYTYLNSHAANTHRWISWLEQLVCSCYKIKKEKS